MKKSFLIYFAILFGFCMGANAQGFYLYKNGIKQTFYSNNVDSIVFFSNEEINGIEAVDLGLPNKTLWSTVNVGANVPEEIGNFYSWGEVKVKNTYALGEYAFYKNNAYERLGVISGGEYDAATLSFGNKWRMPTMKEASELNDYCFWTPVEVNGVAGVRITGQNGNSIFIPNSGYKSGVKSIATNDVYLWCGEEANDAEAYYILAKSDETVRTDACISKYFGLPIRPVISNRVSPYSPISIVNSQASNILYFTATLSTMYVYNAEIKGEEFGFKVYKKGSEEVVVDAKANHIEDYSFSADVEGLEDDCEYSFVPYIKVNGVEYLGVATEFKTLLDPSNGHAYVDLGLPSGILWATMNLGANEVGDFGNEYRFASIVPATNDESPQETTPYYVSQELYTKYWNESSNYLLELEPEDDAAHVTWGGNWRIPSEKDIQELIENCTIETAGAMNSDGSSQNCWAIKGPNGNKIYIPYILNVNGWAICELGTRNINLSSPWQQRVLYIYRAAGGKTVEKNIIVRYRTEARNLRPVFFK